MDDTQLIFDILQGRIKQLTDGHRSMLRSAASDSARYSKAVRHNMIAAADGVLAFDSALTLDAAMPRTMAQAVAGYSRLK
jgi:hypothetical protein